MILCLAKQMNRILDIAKVEIWKHLRNEIMRKESLLIVDNRNNGLALISVRNLIQIYWTDYPVLKKTGPGSSAGSGMLWYRWFAAGDSSSPGCWRPEKMSLVAVMPRHRDAGGGQLQQGASWPLAKAESQDGILPALLWCDGLRDTHLQGWDREKRAHLGQLLAGQTAAQLKPHCYKTRPRCQKVPFKLCFTLGLTF